MSEAEGKDPIDTYDAQYGKPTLADTQKPSGLTEASNKPAEEAVPFKITGAK